MRFVADDFLPGPEGRSEAAAGVIGLGVASLTFAAFIVLRRLLNVDPALIGSLFPAIVFAGGVLLLERSSGWAAGKRGADQRREEMIHRLEAAFDPPPAPAGPLAALTAALERMRGAPAGRPAETQAPRRRSDEAAGAPARIRLS